MQVCDYDLKILAMNARHAGATHDSFIWNNSAIKNEMERNFRNGDDSTWLIGDSGYAQQPWLMTPFYQPLPESPEERYNRAHCRARNCVERCIGVLKMRFRCINGERVLRYNPIKVGSIVNTCAVLHNMCIFMEPEGFEYNGNDHQLNDIPAVHPPPAVDMGDIRRNMVVQNYFTVV